jgi:hypothetical protein
MALSAVVAASSFSAKPLSVNKVRGFMLNAMLDINRDAKKRLLEIVSTWSHHVTFTDLHIRYSGGSAFLGVGTDDEAFFYLDKGTSIRHAVMTRDFVPKTSPGGGFKSGPGQGGLAFVDPNINMPGIEARNWTERLNRDLSIVLGFRIDRAIDEGLKP